MTSPSPSSFAPSPSRTDLRAASPRALSSRSVVVCERESAAWQTLVRDERERELRAAQRAEERASLRAIAEQRRQARQARDEARRGRERSAVALVLGLAALLSALGLVLSSPAPQAYARPAEGLTIATR